TSSNSETRLLRFFAPEKTILPSPRAASPRQIVDSAARSRTRFMVARLLSVDEDENVVLACGAKALTQFSVGKYATSRLGGHGYCEGTLFGPPQFIQRQRIT